MLPRKQSRKDLHRSLIDEVCHYCLLSAGTLLNHIPSILICGLKLKKNKKEIKKRAYLRLIIHPV